MTGGGGRNETVRQKINVQKAFVNRHVSEFLTIWDRDICNHYIYAACFNLFFLTIF